MKLNEGLTSAFFRSTVDCAAEISSEGARGDRLREKERTKRLGELLRGTVKLSVERVADVAGKVWDWETARVRR